MNRILQTRNGHRLRKMGTCRFLESGFTLIELMIVITIIIILLGIAAGRYDKAVLRAREATLKHDLQVMRTAIDSYTIDKETAPQSLDDLVQAQYLHALPVDQITRQKDWVPHFSDVALSPDQVVGNGIDDVHSKSEDISSEGTPYNQW